MNLVPLLLLSTLVALSTAHHCNEFNINLISHSRRNWFGHHLDSSNIVAHTAVTDASDRESESSDTFSSQSSSNKVRETSSVHHPHQHSFLDQDNDRSDSNVMNLPRRRYDHFKSSHNLVINQAKNTKFKSKKDVKEGKAAEDMIDRLHSSIYFNHGY